MSRSAAIAILVLTGAVLSAPIPPIPKLNPDDGVLFDRLPEDARERARSFVTGFLDDYLEDYALGDAELMYGYGYGLDPIALAFIFTPYYDSISWAYYYELNSLYGNATSFAIDNIRNLGPEAPLINALSYLRDEVYRNKMAIVAFVDDEPVVLQCSTITNQFTISVKSRPGLNWLGYFTGPQSIMYSGDDDEIIIHYSLESLYENTEEGGYLRSGGVNYELDNYDEFRKPRYFRKLGVRNYLDDPVSNPGNP